MNTCNTCHWYYHYGDDADGWGSCVWHNGHRGTRVQQIRAGRSDTVLLQVRSDFGCVRWEVDQRHKEAAETK